MSYKPFAWSMKAVRDRCKVDGACLIWQQGTATNGLPRLCVNGKLRQARSFVFCDILGETLPPGHHVCTTCEKPLCLEPQHLVTRSRSESSRAAARRAMAKDPLHFNRLASKFTPFERECIRREAGTYAEKAARHGCSTWTIGRICRVRTKPKPLLTEGEAATLPASSIFDFARTL